MPALHASHAASAAPAAPRCSQLADPVTSMQQLAKLSPLFARAVQRRALIQGAGAPGAPVLSRQDLCGALAQAGAGAEFNDPYR